MAARSNTSERRRQIVQGLRTVMPRLGYEAATIGEIARAARLTPGLIHYHFQCKREILLALVDELAEGMRSRFETRLAGEGASPRARLFAFLDAHLQTGPDEDRAAVACWVTITAEALRQPEVRQVYQAAVTRELEVLTDLVKRAVPGSSDSRARESAVALMAAVLGWYQLATTAPDLVPPGLAAPALRQMAQGLLGEPGADAPLRHRQARADTRRSDTPPTPASRAPGQLID